MSTNNYKAERYMGSGVTPQSLPALLRAPTKRYALQQAFRTIGAALLVAVSMLVISAAANAQVCTAQPGASGPGTVPALPNTYYPGTGTASAGSKFVGIGALNAGGSNTPVAVGDLVLIIQMQDASFSSNNSSSYGGSGPGQGYTSLNNAGAYEYATVAATGGSSITLVSNLLNTYTSAAANSTMGQRTFQVIRVPQYSSATLTGTVTAPSWNGSSGGVVAIDVAGQLAWGGGTIDVAGRGFRGGGGQASTSNATGIVPALNSTDYVSAIGAGTINLAGVGSVPNGAKGEGTAGSPVLIFNPTTPNNNATGTVAQSPGTDGSSAGYPRGSFARGAPGNGGGGGTDGNTTANDQNSGGGGGGSYGDGGTGGYGWTPGTPPGSQSGGFGGAAVPSSATRLFMGGGGGAGVTNNATGTPANGVASSGAAGGGMVFVRAGSTSGTAAINAQGTSANNTVLNDASGGGGGGGQVLVFVNNGGGAISANINVAGGNGGSNTGGGAPHGPGGGGSGGFAILSGAATSLNFAGGANGTTATSATTTANYGSTSSPGGTQIVNLAANSIPGVSPSSSCLPRLTTVKTTSTSSSVPGGTATYTITVTNQNGAGIASTVSINDPLAPTNAFTLASTSAITLGGTASRPAVSNPTAGATSPLWGNFTIPGGGSVAITFVVNVPPSVIPGTYNNNANVIYSDPTRTAAGQTVTPGGNYAGGGVVLGSNYVGTAGGNTGEDVTIRAPLTVAKSFNPTSISANGNSVLQVVITNPNTIALTNVSLTDSYPSGLVNATSPAASSSCGGTIAANAGGTSFGFSGGSIAASGTCTLQVTVTAATAATYDNTIPISGVTSAENVSNAVAATGTLLGRPTIVKAFNSSAVAPNTNSTLTFTVTNPNSTQALSGLAFTDTYPANLVNAAPLTVGGTCTGVATSAVAGGGTFNVTAGNVPASGSCTITIQVTSSVAGNYLNTTSGATTTQTTVAGPPSNTAGLGVGLITISKAIAPAVVAPGQQATITLRLSNPTGVAQTNASFSDTLTNMSVDVGQTATIGGNVGCSGSAILTAGQTSVSFSGVNIPATPAIDTCTVTFTVSSVQVGTNPNTTSGVSTALLPAGPPSNTANLVVAIKPTIAKSFVPSSIQANGTSQLTLTITNNSSVALTGVNFTDAYPAGLVNATPLAVGGTCSGVATSATAGGNSFNVTSATVPASASCTITIAVTSVTAATYNNTSSGVATTQTGIAGSPSNTATLSVISPATIAKAFSPSPIAQGGTSVVTFTVRNGNGVALTNLNFTDPLVNMLVANATIGGTCGATNSPALTVGATSLNLTIPTLAAGAQCTVTVSITSSNPGSNPNVTSGVRSTEGPTAGSPSNSATLDVLTAPVLQKAFVSNDIPVGGTSTMTITVSNPNAVALTNVSFTDALTNMTVNATTASTTCAAGVAGLSFAPALTVGGTQFNPTLTSLAANESCTISVQIRSTVISPAPGHRNTTSGATSTQTSVVPGAPASANLMVSGPPTITKQFVKTASLPAIVPETPLQVGTARATTIIFTLTNPDANVLTGGSFNDTFPAGMTTIAAAQTYTGAGRGTCTGAIPSASTGGAVGAVTFSGVNIPANASCTVFVDVTVTATTAGTITNNVSGVTTTQTPTAGPGAFATLTALVAPTIVKKFSPTSTVGGPANPITLTLTLTNPNATALTGVSVTDVFPATNGGMRVNSTTITPNPPCGAGSTITDNTGAALVAGTSLGIRLNGATLQANSSCTFSIPVQIQTTGVNAVFTNTTGGVTSNETPAAGATDTDTVNRFAAAPLSITKSFSTPVVQTNSSGSANLILVISNTTGATQNITTSALDTFPTTPSAMQAVGGLTITGANCGSLTPTTIAANATSYQITGGSLINGTTCTITIPVKVGATAGTYANTVAGVTSNGNTSIGDAANLIAVAAPTITKAFAPSTIGPGGVSTITFSVTNTSTTTALNNATFTDTLNNMSVAVAGAAGGTCGGASSNTFTAGQTGSISITGLTLPVNAACTVTLQVTSSTVSAALPNTTSGVTTAQTPVAGAGSPTVNLAVVQASVNKAFAPLAIDMDGISTLTFTITNGAGNPAQTGLGFVDTLPTNIVVASTPVAGTTCPAGAIAASPGAGTISFSAGTMNAGQATCTVTVNVTSSVPGGPYNNTTANVTTSNLTNGVTSSGLTVRAQPALTKAFSTATIGGGGTAVLTFTINNTGTGNTARGGLGFTDTLPSGLVIAAAPGVTSNCPAGGAQVAGPGFVTAAAGGGTVNVSGASINAGATCTINVNVTNAANSYGTCPNSAFTNGQSNISGVSSGASLLATSGITNQCLTVSRTTLTKVFAPATIQAGGVSTLTFSLNNGSGNPAQTGLSFIDSLPAGVVVAATPNLKSNCPAGGAQVNNPAFLTAPAGGGTVTVSAAAGMSAGVATCTISVDVTAAAQGAYLNNAARISGLPASGAIDASGVNATLTALSLPLISKAFSPATINADGTSTMTFTITNNNSVALTNGTFTDTLTNIRVSGLQNPPGGTCGATGSYADQQTGALSFTLPSVASGTCTISLLVTSDTPGVLPNTTSPISFTGPLAVASAAGSNTANLTVVGSPPTIAKAFSPTAIPNDGITPSTITFSLSNNNGIALTGVNFTDTLSNMSVAGAQTVGGTCAGAGSNNLANNQTAVSITGVTIPANGGCTLTLTVKSTVVGVQPNTTSGVASTQTARGPVSNTANLTVQPRPTLTKAFGAANLAVNGTTTLIFTVSNTTAGNVARTGLSFTDTLTAGINIANPPVPSSVNCGAPTFIAANATQPFTASNVDVAANTTCTITLTVRGVTAGTTTNGAGDVTAGPGLVNGVTTQTVGVYAPATAAKTIAPASIAPGTNATLTLTLTNPAGNPGAITTVQLPDTFPAGLTLANTTPTFTPGACGTLTNTSGAASAVGDGNARLNVASLNPGASCQMAITVTSLTPGTVTNTTAAPTATGPVVTTGTAVSAPLTVTAFNPPTITKTSAATNLALGGNTNLTLTLGNTNAAAITLSAIFTDTFPAGMAINTAGSTGTCTGVTATAGATSLSIANGSVIPAGGCTVIVNVTSTTAGAKINTIPAGGLSTTGGSNVAPASSTTNFYAAPLISKTFGAASIPAGGSTSLTLVLTNPAANPGPITGVQLDDTFPAGLTIANAAFAFTPGACGTVTKTSGAASTAGDNNIRFQAASLAVGSTCQVIATVTSNTAGTITNTTQAPTTTGPVATTGTPANASLTVTQSDLSPVLTIPAAGAPASTVNGSIVCTNAGPSSATNATCTATAVDSTGATVPVTVGTCTASSGTAANLPSGATLTCSVSYTVPGTAGGSDTTPTNVVVTGTTGATNDSNGGTGTGGNNSTTSTTTIVDAVNDTDAKIGGTVGATTTVATNDQVPAGSTFTIEPGSTCAASSISPAGVATYTVPATGSCIVNYKVCAPAPNATQCDTASLTVTAQVADLSPVLTIPAAGAPASTVNGSIVCTNAGPSSATNATCTATAVDSTGATVPVTVGTCTASSGTAANLPSGATLTCSVSYTVPGTAGGSDTTPTNVVVTGTTGATNDSNGGTGTGGNNSTTSTTTIVDAVNDTDAKIGGTVGATTTVATNDQVPAGSTFTIEPGSTCAASSISPAGVATYTVPATGSCIVNYKVCAPAPNATQCDTASLTVTAQVADLSPVLTIPAAGAPASTVNGSIVCTNAGPSSATNATCTATAVDSTGATVPVTVGTCTASSGTAANLPSGATLTCSVSYTVPGTAGGSDTTPTNVVVTGTTGATNDSNGGTGTGGNNSTTSTTTIVDAVNDTDAKIGGTVGATTTVATNDQVPAGSTFTIEPGSTCAASSISPAGVATYTVPATGSCIVNYKVCAPAPNATQCDTASLTVTAQVADLSPVLTIPAAGAPASTVNGSIVCTNAGPSSATNATCTATAVDSTGATVPVTVGTCTASSGTAANLPSGATLTCSVSYTVPGTAGGSDTTPTNVVVTGTTGATNDSNGGTGTGGNNSTTSTTTIVDAVNDTDAKIGGTVGATTTVATNDQVPAGSTFTIEPGSTCAASSISPAGVATYTVPATGSCIVNYKVCAPAPNATQCDTASLTVTAQVADLSPVLTIPAAGAPASTVNGSIVCTNAGPSSATNATCTATAVDSTGATVPVTVGTCTASSGTAANLPSGATLTCSVSYTVPGTAGGSDTTPTNVVVTGTTGATNDSNGGTGTGGNNSTTSTTTIVDAVNDTDAKIGGTVGATTTVATNDQVPAGSTFTIEPGSTCAASSISPAGVATYTVPATGSCIVNYKVCAPAPNATQCDTASLTVTAQVADLSPVLTIPAAGAPASTVNGSIVCTNAGPSSATNATCTATAVDSTGATVPVTVGTCTASSGTAANLPSGATLTCSVSYTVPGTAGGSDTTPTNVVVTGTTGATNDSNGGTGTGGNNSTTSTTTIVDAVNDTDAKIGGTVGATTTVATNDQVPAGSTFTIEPGSTCAASSISPAGVATYTVPATGSCIVNYKVCAPAPNATQCDTASLTVTAQVADLSPVLTIPAAGAPASTVNGSIVCTNAGPSSATNATCTATAVDSTGATVPVTVGTCTASSGTAANLPSGATLTCSVSYTVPGTAGGSDTTPTNVVVTGTTGATNDSNGGTGTGGNNSTTSTTTIVDAVNDTDAKIGGTVGATTTVATNDQVPAGSTFTIEPGSTCAASSISPAGVATYTVPATGSCIVNYKVCAPAPNATQCDTASLTVTAQVADLSPVLTIPAAGAPASTVNGSIVCTNAGPSSATNATCTATAVDSTGATVPVTVGTCTASSGTAANLPSGATLTCSVSYTVPGTAGGSDTTPTNVVVTGTTGATNDSNGGTGTGGNNSTTSTTTIVDAVNDTDAKIGGTVGATTTVATNDQVPAGSTFTIEPGSTCAASSISPAGVATYTVPATGSCIVNYKVCAPAPNATQCDTASLTVTAQVADLSPVLTIPAAGAPASTVNGSIVCTNAGPSSATNATCTATAVDSTGATVPVTVGTCTASSGTAANLPSGATLTCSVSYTVPGTAGGSDTTPTNVVVTGTTGATNDSNGGTGTGGNNSTTSTTTIVDAVNDTDAKIGGTVGATTTVATNDQVPAGSTFTIEPGSTCAASSISPAGVATYTVPATGSCIVNYKVCAPAPNATQCDTASLTVTAQVADLSPVLTIPAAGAPASTVNGSIVCTNAGPSSATNATCTATAVDSTGATVPVTVGTCTASSGTAANLPSGATLTCSVSYTVPGTAGGSDTTPTNVVVTGTTGATNDSNGGTGTGGNNSTTSTTTIVDAVNDTDAKIGGTVGATTTVATNDQVPAGSTFTIEPGSTCAASSISPAGVATYTVPATGSCIVNYKVCAPAPNATQCDTASLTVTAQVADLSPVLTIPAAGAPASTVNGSIVCTNAGPSSATNATCTATAVDSTGATVPVTVGTCTASSGTAANLPSGATLTCSVSYTVPGTAGGSDTTPTNVVVTGTTGATNDSNGGTGTGGNNSTTSTTTIVDAVNDTDAKIGGTVGATTTVATNDQVPAGSTFTIEPGSTCAASSISPAGVATYTVPATGSCIVNYKVCAPAPNATQCDTASLTVTAQVADLSPVLTIPAAGAPASTVNGSIVCTNAGPSSATNATCTATAVDSTGATVPVTVGTCTASSGTAANLPSGATLTCSVSYTVPGTAGGSDTTPTNVVVTGTTGATNDSNGGTGTGGNNSTTSTTTIVDAVNDTDAKIGGTVGATTTVATNDQVPAGSTFTIEPGSTCAASSISPAGVATYTVPATGSCIVNYKVCAPAPNATQCDTASLTVTAQVADLSPVLTIPAAGAPASTVNGSIVCTNAGPSSATNATCTATAVDSTGATVPVTVGTCTASSGTAANLPSGATLTCSVSYTVPGTAGGSDTTPTNVVVTGTTGATNDSNGGTGTGGNNSTTSTTTIVDAVNDTDAKIGGTVGATTTVATNDQVPAGSTFTIEPGSTCAASSISPAGVATYTVPATGSCIVNYKVCAPAPNATQCDTASLTVTANTVLAPDLALTKTSTSTFVAGSNASFTLTPNNTAGTAATVGVVTVTDTLPSGLTYVAAGSGGAGWTCSVSGQVVTCTTSAVIAAGATGTAITINVAVNSTAVPSVTNVASVGGGGEPAGNTGNNSALLTVPVSNPVVNTFTTDSAQTALPGTSVFYPHAFNAGSAGTVSFATAQSPNPNIAGWVTTIFRDLNCNGSLDGSDGAAPLTGTIAVNAGDQICIIIRNDVPVGAPFNAQDVVTSTATFTPSSGPSINYTRQDVTTVVLNGGLTLTKSVRNVTQGSASGTNNTAKPGDVLEYTITYTNTANAPVSMIVVTDTTPVYTTFVSAVCDTPLPAALTGCSITAPTVGAAGNVVWTLSGSLNATQTGTVSFRVTVQ